MERIKIEDDKGTEALSDEGEKGLGACFRIREIIRGLCALTPATYNLEQVEEENQNRGLGITS
jgi:hypothetical protein